MDHLDTASRVRKKTEEIDRKDLFVGEAGLAVWAQARNMRPDLASMRSLPVEVCCLARQLLLANPMDANS